MKLETAQREYDVAVEQVALAMANGARPGEIRRLEAKADDKRRKLTKAQEAAARSGRW